MTESVSIRLEGMDRLGLAADAWGEATADPVLLSHGGGQTRHSWQSTARVLSERGWHVVNYDHRGHGESDWSPDGVYKIETHAADQKQIARRFARPPVVVGASLGGLSALLAQGETEEQLYRAIILVDIVPQMDQGGALEIIEFMESTNRAGFDTLEEAAEVIARYTGREKRVSPEGLGKNLRLGDDGKYRWHWDPAFLGLRGDVGSEPERMIAAARNVKVPIMLIRGQQSNVVTEESVQAFLQSVPSARYVDVAEARHMVAGDKNEIFTDAVIEFIESL